MSGQTTAEITVRARVILVQDNQVALIRRVRDGATFYFFPGGGVEPGETPEMAAMREAAEELGVTIHLGPLVAVARRASGSSHHFYLATLRGGTFGLVTGPEWSGDPSRAHRGTYEPVWVPLMHLARHDVRPAPVAAHLVSGAAWDTSEPLRFDD